jgi:hypothetical protein
MLVVRVGNRAEALKVRKWREAEIRWPAAERQLRAQGSHRPVAPASGGFEQSLPLLAAYTTLIARDWMFSGRDCAGSSTRRATVARV